jgi:hypothetical protein
VQQQKQQKLQAQQLVLLDIWWLVLLQLEQLCMLSKHPPRANDPRGSCHTHSC